MRLPDVAEVALTWFVLLLGIFPAEPSPLSTVIKLLTHGFLAVFDTIPQSDLVAALTEQCGPDIYCLPKFNVTWTMGSVGLLRWNPNYPTFRVQGFVDIRLYEMTNTRKPVKEWLNITNEDGLWSINLDHSSGIFPEVFRRPKNTTVTRHYRFLVTANSDPIEGKQKGPIFTIEDPPPPEEVNSNPLHFALPISNNSLLIHPEGTSSSAAPHTTVDPDKSQTDEFSSADATKSSDKPPRSSPSSGTVVGIIAGTSIGLMLLIGYPLIPNLFEFTRLPSFTLIYYLIRHCDRANFVRRAKSLNQNQSNFPPMIETHHQNLSRYSVAGYASTEAFLPTSDHENRSHSYSNHDQHILAALPNNSSGANQLSPTEQDFEPDPLRLTVKDAQLIAETYRRLLRKPSWNADEGKDLAKRNTYTDELLRRELQADGKGVKQVNTAPTIIVVNEEQKLNRTSMMSVGHLEELPSPTRMI
ncbi:hypothetical protein K493DRAFT_334152 [Basidiobolus meristosporus CBS 931.73]|uniref:Uncharacterized protein n=1 Tax=Basidiobolus meristosporus CBS 931.73 TaxID=1314790 RepID=A0A1Y1Z0F9_9FUNG|nr:hypothetical protein K493DRAFT_334152 [Basidiobolus meristosporus CBS 931.73]|eukprot:ORY03793.1 hypothetical protein K493DRAFT_334152 [Basidiobolus meristosporus CBS 931.73]